ncbi:MAG TPA: DNA polymerase III subunit beta [Pyrinomonadaceae bacterium]|nr:DNA polymerase III subunit beta [Pyrinomonadaceae bacterium]
MEFSISKGALQKELGFVQGTVEKKNTIPALSNILIESIGENTIRMTGTDLDVTLRCEAEADIKTPGAMCVGARKLFEIVRVLPDAPVNFRKDENNWASVKCERSNFRIAGVERESFPEVPTFKTAPVKMPAYLLKTLIDRTIFAITLEESRYTLSGAKFMLAKSGARMVTTDGHRLAFIEREDLGANPPTENLDVLIPRKTLGELTKLMSAYEGEIGLGADENHIYFEVGQRLLVSRTLAGQFPNYEMVMPKGNDKKAVFDAPSLSQAIRRVALMADDRSHAIRLHLVPGNLHISSQTAEEGEARETVAIDYAGDEVEIGFNAAYLQDFLNVSNEGSIAFEFKDGNSQAQLRPISDDGYDYRYVVMPMRL